MELMKVLWQDGPEVGLLNSFEKFDRFLRALGRRDHFIHQFEVFLFGWFLIDFLVSRGNSLESLTPFKLQPFLKLWLMTAMGHDLGFPLQESPKIFKALDELYGHRSIGLYRTSNLLARLERQFSRTTFTGRPRLVKYLLSGQGAGIDEKIILGIANTTGLNGEMARLVWHKMEKFPNNHGLLSALLLGRAVFHSYGTEAAREKTAATDSMDPQHLYLSLAAIALHHLKEELPYVIKKIEFGRNPFAYLLYLADNLQEWSRDLGGWAEEPTTLLCECKGENSGIILTFLITHDTWDLRCWKKPRKRLGRLIPELIG